jgi:tellurite resistance-related uncharacterized protein
MIRRIAGFHEDEHGDWVAELSCLHNQHVRHRPPFQERPWVTTLAGRASRIGAEIDCPLCERFELPAGLRLARTAGPFDADTVPNGLRTAHRIGEGTWGVLRVLDGSVVFTVDEEPATTVSLPAGARHPIPPLVDHHLTIVGAVSLVVDFLVPSLPAADGNGADPA